MLRTILVDDEKPALINLAYKLSKYDCIEIVGKYTEVELALEKIKEEKIDLIFLDIEMPGIKGINAAKFIKSFNPNINIAFVTAYDHYAVDAFEVEAIDYILKPVSEERLSKTISRVIERTPVNTKTEPKAQKYKAVCFGNFVILSKQGQMIKWRLNKAKELAAYLIHHYNQYIHREKIIEDIWDGKMDKRTEKQLYTSIYYIRKNLKDNGIDVSVDYHGSMYKLCADEISCDKIEFEDILTKITKIDAEHINTLEEAIKLYQGDYLETENYSWAIAEKEQMKELYIRKLKDISNYYLSHKKYENAIFHLEKAIERDPFKEEIQIMLLKSYALNGDYEKKKKSYETLINLYGKELGIDAVERMKEKYAKIT